MSDLIEITRPVKKKAKKTDENDTNERGEIIVVPPANERIRQACRFLSCGPSADENARLGSPPALGQWPEDLVLLKSGVILSVDSNRVCRVVEPDYLAGELQRVIWRIGATMTVQDFPWKKWKLIQCRETIDTWIQTTQRTEKDPKSMAFLSDPEIAYQRLPFDPYMECNTLDDLNFFSPAQHSLLSRSSNQDAMAMAIGRIFDFKADRKQALWIWGPKDCGKSQLQWLLRYLTGEAYLELSSMDLRDEKRWWTGNAIGKRVVAVSEADGCAEFLRSPAFKSLTGESLFSANVKCKQFTTHQNDMLFFFFSNNQPLVGSEKEFSERLILSTMTPFEGPKTPEVEFRKELIEGAPAFVGYCMNRWATVRHRIPCETAEMESIIAENIEIFPRVFNQIAYQDGDGYVALSILEERFRKVYTGNLCFKAFLNKWKELYGIKYAQRKISRPGDQIGGKDRRIEIGVYTGLSLIEENKAQHYITGD